MSEINYQFFDKVDDPYGWCSNFYQLEKALDIDGEKWRDTQSYYQAMKFRHPNFFGSRAREYYNIIHVADSPNKATALGTQSPLDGQEGQEMLNKSVPLIIGIPNEIKKFLSKTVNELIKEYQDVEIMEGWAKGRFAVMLLANFQKFRQNPELKEKIMSLPDDTLLVAHRGDSFWGDGMGGAGEKKGFNYLGKILTLISLKLKYGGQPDKCQSQLERMGLGMDTWEQELKMNL